jgi:vesicular inhibitory amino acid transporter
MIIAITGVSVVGCQIPGNLLFSIAGSPTKLGFTANRGGVILSMLFMQLHVTIAFAVIMMPGFYIFERVLLGLHKHNFDAVIEVESGFDKVETPAEIVGEKAADALSKELVESHELDAATYRQPGVYPKVAAMRIIIIAAAVAIACAWEDKLLHLLDFTGASCIALSCMVLPIVFYLRKCGASISLPEKIWAYFAIASSLFLGGYVTYLSAKPLFNPDPAAPGPAKWDDPKFQFCPAGSSYSRIVFTNVTYHNNFKM